MYKMAMGTTRVITKASNDLTWKSGGRGKQTEKESEAKNETTTTSHQLCASVEVLTKQRCLRVERVTYARSEMTSNVRAFSRYEWCLLRQCTYLHVYGDSWEQRWRRCLCIGDCILLRGVADESMPWWRRHTPLYVAGAHVALTRLHHNHSCSEFH